MHSQCQTQGMFVVRLGVDAAAHVDVVEMNDSCCYEIHRVKKKLRVHVCVCTMCQNRESHCHVYK